MLTVIVIRNELLEPIRALYLEEFAIGMWAQKLIKTKLNIDIPEDEVGYIALHLRTARMGYDDVAVSH